MNNIEIMKLVESKSGEIPLLVKPQLLDIIEAYIAEINSLALKNSPIFSIDMFFKRLHQKGIKDDRFPLLKESLNTGVLLSRVITSYLFDNSLNSPFFPVNYDFDILDQLINNSEDDKSIEIIINEKGKQGKQGRKKITCKPKEAM